MYLTRRFVTIEQETRSDYFTGVSVTQHDIVHTIVIRMNHVAQSGFGFRDPVVVRETCIDIILPCVKKTRRCLEQSVDVVSVDDRGCEHARVHFTLVIAGHLFFRVLNIQSSHHASWPIRPAQYVLHTETHDDVLTLWRAKGKVYKLCSTSTSCIIPWTTLALETS
jgi:hypothetical protein